jgi:arylsulfatase A-like enzyme
MMKPIKRLPGWLWAGRFGARSREIRSERALGVIAGMAAVLLSATVGVAADVAKHNYRPNLIAIVADDLARWAVGAYGNSEVHTPNLDRLAAEGLRFTHAFVETPVCSPSRATYLTGLYPTEHTIQDAIDPAMDYTRMGFRSPTWPTVLQQHGYKTALLGKWHLGAVPEFFPTRHGIDHFFGWLDEKVANIDPIFEVSPGSRLPRWQAIDEGGVRRGFPGALVDVLTDQAIAFIDAHRDAPFAVLLHHLAPHKPYLPVLNEDLAPYRDLDPAIPPDLPAFVPRDWFRTETKAYYASVTSLDRSLGRLLRYLDETGQAQNTLIVFTSDHGYSVGRHGIETKGNGRFVAAKVERGPRVPNMYDNSMRIPLIVRWPDVIKPGTVEEGFASNIDLFRTYLAALGVPLPGDFRGHGRDLSPAFRGQPLSPKNVTFGQYDINQGILAYLRMVRTDRWKYIRHFRTYFADELYDLVTDPYELDNLLSRGTVRPGSISNKELNDLQNRLLAWMQSIDDPLLHDSY